SCSLRLFFFFQAEDGIRDFHVTGVQTCALPISSTERKPKPCSCSRKAVWPSMNWNTEKVRSAMNHHPRRAASPGALLFRALEHLHLDHLVAVAQFVHVLHAAEHLAEHGVHPVQMGLGSIANVKLGAARVGAPVGHGHG